MDTDFIETMIKRLDDGAQPDPELLDLLAVLAERQGVDAGPDELLGAARFVTAYIGLVPYMMKIAWTSASNVGLEKEMECVLETAESYWREGDDVIPDELGVIGLMDDAYCSMTLLQAVSDNFRLLTGKHLFPDDLTAANQAMRQVIGEPYATELDRLVLRTVKETGLVESVRNLAEEKKRINLGSDSTIWNHGPVSRIAVRDLAALGITDD